MLSDPQKPYRREAGVRFLRVPQEGLQALLCDSTVSQFSMSQDRRAGVSAFCLGFFMPISTHLEPRFWGYKSNRITPYTTAAWRP